MLKLGAVALCKIVENFNAEREMCLIVSQMVETEKKRTDTTNLISHLSHGGCLFFLGAGYG